MRAASLARLARSAGVGVLVTAITGCATVNRHVTVYQSDDRGGLYPAGPISGEPSYHVGWRIYR